MWKVAVVLCVAVLQFFGCDAMIDDLYCGEENCYDVLGVTRDHSRSEIARAYRQLAKKYHPDMHRTEEGKEEAEKKFTMIATAYEILRDEETRTDYDYMLDNPDEFYSHYYRYYKRRMTPKVDVRLVIAVTISVISAFQYYTAWYRYETAIKYLVTVPKYRLHAVDIANKEGMLDNARKKRRRNKEEAKEEEDSVIRKVIEEKMDIRGGYAKPSVMDILLIQIVILPYTLTLYFMWYSCWVWKYTIRRKPYEKEDKLYLIRKYLGLSEGQFEALSDNEKEDYLGKKLWILDNFKVWKREQEEKMRLELAENSRYKAYRRYMKNHGPGRMYFDDS